MNGKTKGIALDNDRFGDRSDTRYAGASVLPFTAAFAARLPDALIDDIDRACTGARERFVQRLLGALRHHAATTDLLDAFHPAASAGRDRPHRTYHDPEGRFRVVLKTWQPGESSDVHAHDTWRALAVIDGWLREDLFERTSANDAARRSTSAALLPGSAQFRLPGDATIHRLGNVGSCPAISLHIHGITACTDA